MCAGPNLFRTNGYGDALANRLPDKRDRRLRPVAQPSDITFGCARAKKQKPNRKREREKPCAATHRIAGARPAHRFFYRACRVSCIAKSYHSASAVGASQPLLRFFYLFFSFFSASAHISCASAADGLGGTSRRPFSQNREASSTCRGMVAKKDKTFARN